MFGRAHFEFRKIMANQFVQTGIVLFQFLTGVQLIVISQLCDSENFKFQDSTFQR